MWAIEVLPQGVESAVKLGRPLVGLGLSGPACQTIQKTVTAVVKAC